MALFELKWLRRWVRRHTNPIPEDSAQLWKRRLSIGYALLAWNAFGFVCYMVYTGRNDWAKYYGYKSEEEAKLTPAQQYATQLNVNKGKIIRFSGFNRVGETEFDNTSEKVE
ncbi:uncharacterized protein LOC126760486 [Bactrocera neohumeralis]|uniref:uncharacterized protein LOC126760486 n=1 Tax=Bactrocera neohumeralis TaxID=98809 RepID=UPI0021668C8E|nr:uncharacterized protein LOC126760486 [Bactrocera neohumeralis]XP_050332103.1 uncharacterized protein LOC126760486 [Bactrocera neohumeralis]